ncbi:MAG: hypothetical protein ACTSU8_03145 [Alphaproteobacteria bacterium]
MSMKKKPDINDRALDEALKNMQALEPAPDLARRIMVDARQTLGPRPLAIFWPFGKIWQPVSVMVAATILGIWFGIGAVSLDQADVTDEIETMLMG